MKNSIIKNSKSCFYCGSERDLDRHHCLHGTANRKLAEEDGLWIWVCREHHNMIHGNEGHCMDVKLKQTAEYAWLQHNNKTIQEFIDRYGKNWL